LRRDGIAARDTLKCVEMAPTVDPEDALKAADAIEAQAKRIEELEASIDKNDEWVKWFIEKTDARIAELEAALKPFADYWEPGTGLHCQNVDTKEVGARAAADVFKRYGFTAYAGSRLD